MFTLGCKGVGSFFEVGGGGGGAEQRRRSIFRMGGGQILKNG